ncbi:energy transducer TonB [Massilia yuzhufengensis]|uniref:Outer membrane transport energization protein TonB n=1 Tax=Massilia yuzhufengensis TaxID=1164594 RepID=A0A1I1V578_9BURK|nr:energy transducer TonB [Massilia yuzhufengensis]SFD75470.1 outer membrane transport energization protein TonB [Massilia yuzhufengensis]
MHFTQINDGTGGKAGKFALVTGLHVLVAVGLVNVMNSKTISMPKLIEDATVWIQPEITPPPPPPEPPQPRVEVAKPQVVVPKVEVETPPPPVQEQVQATTEAQPQPEPALPSSNDAPPAQPSSNTNPGEMRSAVLADANGCAKPDYPVNAARNGDTGTVTLALMVGADGRVQGSRVQKSSGSRELDRAAVNALSLCQFKPAMNNGSAEAGWAQIAYVWTLE